MFCFVIVNRGWYGLGASVFQFSSIDVKLYLRDNLKLKRRSETVPDHRTSKLFHIAHLSPFEHIPSRRTCGTGPSIHVSKKTYPPKTREGIGIKLPHDRQTKTKPS